MCRPCIQRIGSIQGASGSFCDKPWLNPLRRRPLRATSASLSDPLVRKEVVLPDISSVSGDSLPPVESRAASKAVSGTAGGNLFGGGYG